MCETPPGQKTWMTRFARGVKCGPRAASARSPPRRAAAATPARPCEKSARKRRRSTQCAGGMAGRLRDMDELVGVEEGTAQHPEPVALRERAGLVGLLPWRAAESEHVRAPHLRAHVRTGLGGDPGRKEPRLVQDERIVEKAE